MEWYCFWVLLAQIYSLQIELKVWDKKLESILLSVNGQENNLFYFECHSFNTSESALLRDDNNFTKATLNEVSYACTISFILNTFLQYFYNENSETIFLRTQT